MDKILSLNDFDKEVFPFLKKMGVDEAANIRPIIQKRVQQQGEKTWRYFCHEVDDCCEDKSICSDLGISERVRNKEAAKATIAVYYCFYRNNLKSTH